MKKATTLKQCFGLLQDNDIVAYKDLKFKLYYLEPYGGAKGKELRSLQQRFGYGNIVLLNVYHNKVKLMLTIEMGNLGNTLRYFKNIQKPITVDRILRAFNTGYFYNRKEKVMIFDRTRCVYDEGKINSLHYIPHLTFDYMLKSFKEDFALLGIHIPTLLQSELMKLKGKSRRMETLGD